VEEFFDLQHILSVGFLSLMGFMWRAGNRVTRLEQKTIALGKQVDRLQEESDKNSTHLYSINKRIPTN